jgi:transcriptional regulator with XRE-family HTH domain
MWHHADMIKSRPAPSPRAIALGTRIKTAREKVGCSQESLARMLGVTKGLIGQYEIGYTTPRAQKVSKLAGLLNVTVEWLLTGDEPEEKVRAQTTTEMAALQLIRAMHADKHAAALAMLQGLAGTLSKD